MRAWCAGKVALVLQLLCVAVVGGGILGGAMMVIPALWDPDFHRLESVPYLALRLVAGPVIGGAVGLVCAVSPLIAVSLIMFPLWRSFASEHLREVVLVGIVLAAGFPLVLIFPVPVVAGLFSPGFADSLLWSLSLAAILIISYALVVLLVRVRCRSSRTRCEMRSSLRKWRLVVLPFFLFTLLVGALVIVALIDIGSWVPEEEGDVMGKLLALLIAPFFIGVIFQGYYVIMYRAAAAAIDRKPEGLILVVARGRGAGTVLSEFGWEPASRWAWAKQFVVRSGRGTYLDQEVERREIMFRLILAISPAGVGFWVGFKGEQAAWIPRERIRDISLLDRAYVGDLVRPVILFSVDTREGVGDVAISPCYRRGIPGWVIGRRTAVEARLHEVREALGLP